MFSSMSTCFWLEATLKVILERYWEITVLARTADIRLLSVAWVKTEDNNLNNNWVILHGRHL